MFGIRAWDLGVGPGKAGFNCVASRSYLNSLCLVWCFSTTGLSSLASIQTLLNLLDSLILRSSESQECSLEANERRIPTRQRTRWPNKSSALSRQVCTQKAFRRHFSNQGRHLQGPRRAHKILKSSATVTGHRSPREVLMPKPHGPQCEAKCHARNLSWEHLSLMMASVEEPSGNLCKFEAPSVGVLNMRALPRSSKRPYLRNIP